MIDCKGCARCCYSTEMSPKISVHYGNSIPDEMIERKPFMNSNRLYMKIKDDGSCMALGDNGECSIYENRPAVCRAFNQASSICKRLLAMNDNIFTHLKGGL